MLPQCDELAATRPTDARKVSGEPVVACGDAAEILEATEGILDAVALQVRVPLLTRCIAYIGVGRRLAAPDAMRNLFMHVVRRMILDVSGYA